MKRWIVLCAVLMSTGALAEGLTDLKPRQVRDVAGQRLSAKSAQLLPTVKDRATALDALAELTSVRQDMFNELVSTRVMTTLENIRMADAVDDSLVTYLTPLLERYVEKVPKRITHPGAEKFSEGLRELGFVQQTATGFLVHLEMQQILLVLADFQSTRSEAEVEAAEDAFLRHMTELCQLHRAEHETLEDLHACNLVNMEWTIGRIESESGADDFVLGSQFFADRDTLGFAYFLKLLSPSTGEILEIFYPLPYLTQMDDGWPERMKRKVIKDGPDGI